MPKLFVLVGLPASGKSTWRNEYLKANPDTVVISQDDLIEAFAKANRLTYSEAFQQADLRKYEKQVYADFEAAVAQGKDIILDRTNVTAKGRAQFLKRLSPDYTKTAVRFIAPDDVLSYRLRKRAKTDGKFIPDYAIRNFKSSFVEPTLDEFHSIQIVEAKPLTTIQRIDNLLWKVVRFFRG